MTVQKAACFPSLTLTIHRDQAETLCALFKNEATRLEKLERLRYRREHTIRLYPTNEPSITPKIDALRAIVADVEKVLNALDPTRAAFVEDHG
jgi:hypothetical protein